MNRQVYLKLKSLLVIIMAVNTMPLMAQQKIVLSTASEVSNVNENVSDRNGLTPRSCRIHLVLLCLH